MIIQYCTSVCTILSAWVIDWYMADRLSYFQFCMIRVKKVHKCNSRRKMFSVLSSFSNMYDSTGWASSIVYRIGYLPWTLNSYPKTSDEYQIISTYLFLYVWNKFLFIIKGKKLFNSKSYINCYNLWSYLCMHYLWKKDE